MLFGLAEIVPQRLGDVLGSATALIPRFEEQLFEQAGGLCCRAQALQNFAELPLDQITLDGFAPAGAALGEAEIIRVLLPGLALRPASGERPAAFGAHGIAAQREILADIIVCEDARAALDALLDALKRLKVDQALMMALAKRDAPMRHFDISGIMRAAEEAQHLFVTDSALLRLAGVFRLGFEEALDLALCLEAARCKALKCFLYDGSERLVAHKQEAVPGNPLVFISCRGVKHPIAVHGAGAHAVLGLLAVLLALMLAGARQHVLDKDRIGIIAEGDRGAFQLAARQADGKAQIGVDAGIARKAADIIDNDGNLAAAAVVLQEG